MHSLLLNLRDLRLACAALTNAALSTASPASSPQARGLGKFLFFRLHGFGYDVLKQVGGWLGARSCGLLAAATTSCAKHRAACRMAAAAANVAAGGMRRLRAAAMCCVVTSLLAVLRADAHRLEHSSGQGTGKLLCSEDGSNAR